MKKLVLVPFLCICMISCNKEIPIEFSDEALNDTFVNLNGDEITFQSILDTYKGQTIFIDLWASWCSDCLKSLPLVKALQTEYPEVIFLFLSVDKSQKQWKEGINKHNISGEHFYLLSRWDGDFSDFVDLDWTPRYMIIDKDQKIKLFEAIKANDKRIKELLQ